MKTKISLFGLLFAIALTGLSQNYNPFDNSGVKSFVQAMVKLNDNLEENPQYLTESIYFFKNYLPLENRMLFLKAIFSHPLTDRLIRNKSDLMFLKNQVERYSFDPFKIVFTKDISDFKPHYLCRLAYKQGFSVLRLLYEDNFTSEEVNCGYINGWRETKDHNLIMEVSNSNAYKGKKFYLIDLSVPSAITFVQKKDTADPDIKYLELLKVQDNDYKYGFLKDDEVTMLTSRFNPTGNVCTFSKYLELRNTGLYVISTDSGLSIYNSKTNHLIKFIRNFYSGNDVE
jgi:hypothetical protein